MHQKWLKPYLSGSAQHLSGGNGGCTIGCFGQKLATSTSANKEIFSESEKYFGQRTADMNKFNISHAKPNKQSKIFAIVYALAKKLKEFFIKEEAKAESQNNSVKKASLLKTGQSIIPDKSPLIARTQELTRKP